MRISDIRPVLLTAPYGAPGAQAGRRSACFVEVETDEGIVGLGETYAGMYVPDLAAAIVNWFKPLLVGSAFKARATNRSTGSQADVKNSAQEAIDMLVQGLDACNPDQVYRLGYWVASSIGRTGLMVMVLSAIENAIWDIQGKALGMPVHALLGGAVHRRLPVYASGGIPAFSIDQLVEQAKAARAAGYLGFKMKTNFFAYQPEVEAERVAAVREVIGPNMALAIDAVQSLNLNPWSVKQVVKMLDRLAPYDLAWAEEMLQPIDPAPYAELRRTTPVPIAGGEGITTAAQFEHWVRSGAFDLAQPDATIIGGIGEARRACEFARAYDVRAAVHVWGSAPAIMANYNLAFAQANSVWLERPTMYNPLEEELLVAPLQMENGFALPSSAPGLGVKLTSEIKAKYPYIPGSATMIA
jgi:L-alanine-DL-glutamate epimerase-like enolase superfamily enzyme